MVRLRLRRVGGKNQASYRIVAADQRSPRDGRFLENLGHYNPRTEPATVVVDEARLYHWLKRGAQPSEPLVKVLKPGGTWERWERYKQGEALETLLEEAAASVEQVDPRTRRDDIAAAIPPKKAPAKAKAVEEQAEAVASEDAPESAASAEEAEQSAEQAEVAEEEEAPAAEPEAVSEADEPEAEEVAEESEE